MMMVSAAVGLNCFGRKTHRCRSLAIFSEDDNARIHERRDRICYHPDYNIDPLDLDDGVAWKDCDDIDDPVIYRYPRFARDGQPSRLWLSIADYCERYAIEMLILDHAANVYEGDELHVKRFMWWLRKQSKILQLAIVLLIHPDKARTSWYAGNRAWGDSVRHAISLQKPRRSDGEAPSWEDDGERELISPKSNLLPYDDPLKRQGLPIRWDSGVLVMREAPPCRMPLSTFEKAELDAKVWQAIKNAIKKGREIKSDPKDGRSFARRVADVPGWNDYPRWELEASVDRLIDGGRLVVKGSVLGVPG